MAEAAAYLIGGSACAPHGKHHVKHIVAVKRKKNGERKA